MSKPSTTIIAPTEDREAVVAELLDTGDLVVAEDGVLEVVSHEYTDVVATLIRLGLARRASEPNGEEG